jgi:hypothetical protein
MEQTIGEEGESGRRGEGEKETRGEWESGRRRGEEDERVRM